MPHSPKPHRGRRAPHAPLDMIGGRDAPRPAEDDLIPGAAVENVRHLRPVALETTVRLAEAVLVPPAFFVPAAAPEEQHVGMSRAVAACAASASAARCAADERLLKL